MNFNQFREVYPKSVIRLGITMAGAVSAGAYSAGVMTYILQNLKTWEKLKNENYKVLFDSAKNLSQKKGKKLTSKFIIDFQSEIESGAENAGFDKVIPMHDVILDVLGGASAGSLVAAITMISFARTQKEISPFDLLNEKPNSNGEHKIQGNCTSLKDNLLFDSWANLNAQDVVEKDSFSELLEIDIEESKQPFALLNPKLLDRIKEYQLNRVFKSYRIEEESTRPYKPIELPRYVSRTFKAFFSLTSLRGISFGIRFSNTKQNSITQTKTPAHNMRLHTCMGIFHANHKNADQSMDSKPKFYPHDFYNRDHAHRLVEVAFASGAFPIGLPPRKIILTTEYVRNYVKRTLGEINIDLIDINLEANEVFELAAIDGGTLNNEPFTEVYQDLIRRVKAKTVAASARTLYSLKDGERIENEHEALILIDPFPNFEKTTQYKYPVSLKDIVFNIIGALRGQAMVKDNRKMEALTQKNQLIGMIFPSRRDAKGNKLKPALATGTLDGFAGFISREFRIHDFYLGMRNAQSFIRQYFHIEEKNNTGLSDFDKGLNHPSSKTFSIMKNGNLMHPIIPDIELFEKREDINSDIMADRIPVAEFPTISADILKKYQPLLYKRIHFLLSRLLKRSTSNNRTSKKKLFRGFTIPKRLIVVLSLIIISIVAVMYYFLPCAIFWSIFILMIILIVLAYQYFLQWASHKIIEVFGESFRINQQLDSK